MGGDEHHLIRVESDPARVYKLTQGDNFGCQSYFSPHDPELAGRHFHGTGNADPFYDLPLAQILRDCYENPMSFLTPRPATPTRQKFSILDLTPPSHNSASLKFQRKK